MKRALSFVLAFLFLTASAGAVDLYVDNDLIDTDTPPTIVDGRTLVPVRAIFEAIGAAVEWDGATSTATGIRDGVTVQIQIGNTTAYVNGEARTLDVPAQIINSRTMVPARFISEAMGCDVTWDQATQTVGVAYQLKGVALYATPTGEKYHYDSSCSGDGCSETTLAEAMGRGLTACEKCVLANPDSGFSTTPNSPSESTASTPSGSGAVKKSGNYVGSVQSDKYHYASCRYAKKIEPENEIWFDTVSEAQAAGYTACGVCHPS